METKQVTVQNIIDGVKKINDLKIVGHISGRHLVTISEKSDIYSDNEYCYLDEWITGRIQDAVDIARREALKEMEEFVTTRELSSEEWERFEKLRQEYSNQP